jgi:hypothetical protein
MTFKKWLAQFIDENSPRGDFARDVLADAEFPDTKNISKINDYLFSVGMSDRNFATDAINDWLRGL